MANPTLFAIPAFAAMIAFEAWQARRVGSDAFSDRKDTFTNIALGFGSVACGAVIGLLTGAIYLFAYSVAPFKMPTDAWWSWALLFLLDDLAYYWFHRLSHESRFMWNFHVVHHSSDQYNLSVAVRQSWFGNLVTWMFYAPLMLLGFAPWMFAITHGVNLIYQFWIHTKLIGKLGVFEKIFNTPSLHRVHHAVNPQYIDKNYGGILIIWDRIFGSHEIEDEVPRYGIIKPINSYNLLWVNTHAWKEMFDEMRGRSTIFEKIRCFFAAPDMIRKQNNI